MWVEGGRRELKWGEVKGRELGREMEMGGGCKWIFFFSVPGRLGNERTNDGMVLWFCVDLESGRVERSVTMDVLHVGQGREREREVKCWRTVLM